MNKKIRALAEQAGIHFEEGKQSRIHYVNTGTLDKFAESIVYECVSIAQAGNAQAVVTVIKETFGVKE